jgi:putative hemolysin
MKNLHLVGLSALLSLVSFACASPSEPSSDTGEQQSPVSGEPGQPAPGPSGAPSVTPAPAPAPAPTPAPTPAPGCTPLAKSNGSANPASVYCGALGYQWNAGQCAFPDGSSCEEWSFYRGECGQAHSFCNLHGGTVSNRTENMGTWTATYAMCTLPTGKECHEDAFAQSCSCE